MVLRREVGPDVGPESTPRSRPTPPTSFWNEAAAYPRLSFDTVAAAAEGCDALVATGVMPAGVSL
jgi:hypothetical protein